MSEAFIERLQTEAGDLSARLLKLDSFIKSEAYDAISAYQKDLLVAQQYAMKGYLKVLGMRLVDLAKHSGGEDV